MGKMKSWVILTLLAQLAVNWRLWSFYLGTAFQKLPGPEVHHHVTANHHHEETEKAREKVHLQLHNFNKKMRIGAHETLLTFFLSSILKEDDGDLLPEGSILDCGAQFGEQGAHYAVSSTRKVVAMDPSPTLVQHMNDNWGSLENLEIRQGGLGLEVGTMKPRDNTFNMDMDGEFPVYTLDSMYFDKGEKLAFAHLDLEGLELDVLRGGLNTIRSNKPVFTVELRVHEEKTTPLLDLIDSLGYDTYVIDEPCGMPPMDLRNILCIPRSKSDAFGRSNSFNLLLAMDGIKRVTAENIAQIVLPCCALGGECCPGTNLNGPDCCTEKVVLEWHSKNRAAFSPPAATIGFKIASQNFMKIQYRLRQRRKVP